MLALFCVSTVIGLEEDIKAYKKYFYIFIFNKKWKENRNNKNNKITKILKRKVTKQKQKLITMERGTTLQGTIWYHKDILLNNKKTKSVLYI